VAKRPSLATVMDKSAEQMTDAPQPVAAPRDTRTQTVTAQRKPGKRSSGWVQLNSYVPGELRTRAKVKALQQNRDLSDIVTELLEDWVNND
jgi:hypothetical protein